MIVFNNRDRPNYEQIVDMAPKWLNEYREMNANNRFAGWTLDLMTYFLDQIVLNEFPKYCDEPTLRAYEKIFLIEYDGDASLDERRRTVMAYWSGIGKINKTAIMNMVSMYTGAIAEVRWDDGVLIIDFDNTATRAVSMGMLQKIVRRRMPAHIDYRLRCVCSVGLRILSGRTAWRTIFEQTGTRPGVSTGLGLVRNNLNIDTGKTRGFRAPFSLSGETETGTKPDPSTRLALRPSDLNVNLSGTGGHLAPHIMSGMEDTGTVPDQSTRLSLNHNQLTSEVETDSWGTEYQMCGETFDL